MNIFSPKEINVHVQELLVRIGSQEPPVLVQVQPETYARPDECYYNVAEKVQRDGGRIRYGWAIWQSELICEAEHHAVWQSPESKLLCISPRRKAIDQIMFAPDDSKVYQGVSFDNIRLNITGNTIVDDLINLFAINEKLFLLGERIDAYSISLPTYVEQQILRNRQIMHNLELFALEGGRPESPCFCQGGSPFNRCHGERASKRVEEEYEALLQFHQRRIS